MANDFAEAANQEIASVTERQQLRHVTGGRWHGAAFLMGVVCLGICLGIQALRNNDPGSRRQALLVQGFADLELGELDAVDSAGHQVLRDGESTPAEQATACFLLGSRHFLLAPRTNVDQRRFEYDQAVQIFQVAESKGLPEAHRPLLEFRFGASLLALGEPKAALPRLKRALELLPQRRVACLRLLAQAYGTLAEPDYAAAAEALCEVLADDAVPNERRRRDRLHYARLLVQLKRNAEAIGQLDAIPAESTEAAQALFWRARALAALGRHEQAVEAFGRAANSMDLPEPVRRESAYLRTESLRQSDPAPKPEQLIESYVAIRSLYEETPEAAAAAVRQAEVLWQANKPAESLELLEETLARPGQPSPTDNAYVPLTTVGELLGDLWQQRQKQHDFGTAIRIAQLLTRIDAAGDGRLRLAESAKAWAEFLSEAATQGSWADRQARLTEADQRFTQAGDAFAALAQQRQTDARFGEYLRLAAWAYYDGDAYAKAIGQLGAFLAQPEGQEHRPQALVKLARSYQETGNMPEAIRHYDQVIQEFPKNVAEFEARYRRAVCHLESGEVDEAKSQLLGLLNNPDLEPEATEWRLSLLAVGRLCLEQEQDYAEATERLSKFIRFYPDDAQAQQARFLLASAYDRWAQAAEQEAPADGLARTRALRLARQRRTAALAEYGTLVQKLEPMESADQLSPLSRKQLRNSRFCVGECRFHLGQFEPAIEAYEQAASQYPGTIWAVIAHVWIARCYKQQQKDDLAKRSLDQAEGLLDQLPESEFHEAIMPLSRERWKQWIRRGLQ